MPSLTKELATLLRQGARGDAQRQEPRLRQLISSLELATPANLAAPQALEMLEGVWELRWSSSSQSYLRAVPWLENLQILAPSQGRAMNLLRFPGSFAGLGGIAVEASISIDVVGIDHSITEATGPAHQRVQVRFERGGWRGPLLGRAQPQWLLPLQQSFPAWLDITVLDAELRLCRGNAGTLFALVRRSDLSIGQFLRQARD